MPIAKINLIQIDKFAVGGDISNLPEVSQNETADLAAEVHLLKPTFSASMRQGSKRKLTVFAYLVLLNAPLRQESQNRCPQTDTWTAFRTGRWQIRHNKFSLTAGTKKARYPGMSLQWILLSFTKDDSWSDRLLLQNYLLSRRLHFVTGLRGVFLLFE